MSRGWKIVLGVGIAIVVGYVALLALLFADSGSGAGAWGTGPGTVGVIRMDGVISAESTDSIFSSEGIDPITAVETLREADADSGIDAVVLRINSPGGSPAASWEIYQAVRAMNKPVVVSVADIAASGAYYVASGADEIVAAPSSQVGSIGVILVAQDLEGLFEKVGIRYTVLTKGKYKDIGTVDRQMTAEEKRVLQGQIDTVYEQFIADVAEGRPGLDADQVRELATGLTYPGEEALRLGLIDAIGSFTDALDSAAAAAGLGAGDYSVRYIEPQAGSDFLSLLLGFKNQALKQVGLGLADGLQRSSVGGSRIRLE